MKGLLFKLFERDVLVGEECGQRFEDLEECAGLCRSKGWSSCEEVMGDLDSRDQSASKDRGKLASEGTNDVQKKAMQPILLNIFRNEIALGRWRTRSPKSET